MRTRIDRTAEFLRGLVDLPPSASRRIVTALAAKAAGPPTDDLLDQAAAAMQAAMEAAVFPIIETAAAELSK